MAIWTKVYERV